VAEDQKMLQPPFPLHGLESEKRPQGFAGAGSSEQEYVLARVWIAIKSTAKQLNQLLLPLPWSDHRCRWPVSNIKTEQRDSGCGKDESF
jgi:hypothetical protein